MKKMLSLLILAVLATAFLTGCASSTIKKLAKDLDEYEKLGIKQITVKSNFNSTDYTVEHADGKRTATIKHHSVYVPELVIIRETPEDKK